MSTSHFAATPQSDIVRICAHVFQCHGNAIGTTENAWFSVALRPRRWVGLLGTGTEWEGDERVKGSTAETARKRPERPWTAARTMEVLGRCPLAIAQQLVHCAIALSTAVLDRITKTMSVAPLLTNNLDNSKQKTSNLLSPAPPPYSWSLLGKCEGPAPPPSSKISWSFDLAWNPAENAHFQAFITLRSPTSLFSANVNGNCVKNHPQLWTCPLNIQWQTDLCGR